MLPGEPDKQDVINTAVGTPPGAGRFAAWNELVILGGFCAYLFFYGLGSFGLVGADEPRYAQIAREMLARRDWITPVLNGAPWLEKPALYYWSAMLSYKVFGVSDWAARLPSCVFATAMVVAIYAFTRRFRGMQLDAALMAASSAAIVGFARGASTDMPLAATFTIGMLAWDAWRESGCKLWLAGFYLMMALGALAKGPVAPVLAGLIILVFAFVVRSEMRATRWRLIALTLWAPGILLFFAIALPWYIAVQWKTHQFLQVFILQHNLERFGTNLYHHKQPVWYYLPVFVLSVLPWTVYVMAAIVAALRRALARAGCSRDSRLEGAATELNLGATPAWRKFLLIWVAVPLVLFTISQSKLPGYILPAIPPCALLLAGWLRTRLAERASIAISIAHSLVCGLLLAGALLAPYFIVRLQPPPQATAIAAVAGAVIAVAMALSLRWQGLRILRFVTLVPVVLGLAFLLRVSAPVIDRAQSARPVAAELARLETRHTQLAAFNISRELEYGLDFYRNQPVLRYEHGEVPAGDHLLIARSGSEPHLNPFLGNRRCLHVGSFPPQRLEFYWVASGAAHHH
jgi:4-amino-4-deoxy-L-arabinose transferase-like glycosyltransferase